METYKSIRKSLLEKKKLFDALDREKEQEAIAVREQADGQLGKIKEEYKKQKDRMAKVNAYLSMAESKKCAHVEPAEGKPFDNAAMMQYAVQLNSALGAESATKLYTEATAQKINLQIELDKYKYHMKELSEGSVSNLFLEKGFDEKTELLKKDINDFWHSAAVHSFKKECAAAAAVFSGDERLQERRSKLALGSVPLDLFTAGEGQDVLDDWVQDKFAEGEKYAVPLTFDMTKGQLFLVEFEPINEAFVIAGIQNVLYNFLFHRKGRAKQILMVDPVRNNDTALGALSAICGMPASPVCNVPTEPVFIRQAVGSFLETVKEEEQNRSDNDNDAVADRLVVFHDFPVGYDSEQIRWIQELCVSAKHYRTVIFVTYNKAAETNKNIREMVNMIQGYANCIYSRDNRFYLDNLLDGEVEFVWYKAPPALTEEAIASFEVEDENQALNNAYEAWINIKEPPRYVKGKRRLDYIPYGLDEDGMLQALNFEYANFACYVCGASRSGKSTFLHTLIASIMAVAHPDDVEVWLIDFKKTEFSRYIEHMPPHIRYVVLDESPELVYDIIDRLTEILHKRQNQFMGKWEKLTEVPTTQYMPEIFVIIDEFSKMSQVLSDTAFSSRGDYTIKLQNLLTAGAAFGFKFIFSSQDFSEGTRGLTSTAKKQIQQRIAMYCQEPGEIKETLGLLHASEADNKMMENLKVHHTLMRIPENSEGNHLKLTKPLFFPDKDVELQFIDRINQSVQPVKKYSPEDTQGYIYKRPLIIDGNSYTAFSDKKELLQKEALAKQEEGETHISLGEPKRLLPVFLAPVLDSYGENILMITPVNEASCGASVVYTAAETLRMQGRNVRLWGYKRAPVYKAINAELPIFDGHINTLSDVCREIGELRSKIENKISGNEFIFITGIDSYMADMAFLPPKSDDAGAESRQTKTTTVPSVTYEARQEGEPDLFTLLQMAKAGVQPTENTGENAIPAAAPIQDSVAEIQEDEVKGEEYDAREDLKFILTQGARYGYHFCLILSAWQEMKQCRLKTDDFRHKILFRMPKSEAAELVNGANAAVTESLDEHAFRYTNGINSLTLRPYLHEGLTWSGCYREEDEDENYLE